MSQYPQQPKKKVRRGPPKAAAPVAKPLTDEKPKRGIGDRVVVAGLGVIMFGYSVYNLMNPPTSAVVQPDGKVEQITSMADSFPPVGSSPQLWKNPQKGLIEKHFCEGNQNSASCSDRFLHPFVREFEKAGIDSEEFLTYLGWKNEPSPGDENIVDDTLIYPNKASKLFGKAVQGE